MVEIDTRKFLEKVVSNWRNHQGTPPEYSGEEDVKIMECLALGYLNPEAFQETSDGYWQGLYYPLTEKGKACIEEHFWLRLKRTGWLQMTIDIMAVIGFFTGATLTLMKIFDIYQR